MKLIPEVKIGPFNYSVKYPYAFAENHDRCGQHGFDRLAILVSDRENDSFFSDERTVVVLLHEVTHAIDTVFTGNEQLEERSIDLLAKGMFQVIKTNNLDFKSIPNKLNIMGFTMEICYPYEFEEDSETASIHSPTSCKILIGNSMHEKVAMYHYMIHIITSITDILGLEEFEELDVKRFATGFLSVFQDNPKLLELIRSDNNAIRQHESGRKNKASSGRKRASRSGKK